VLPATTTGHGHLVGFGWGAAEVIGVVAIVATALATFGGLVPPAAGIAIALLVPPAVVDVHEHRLPDVWIATALGGFATALVVDAAVGGSVHLPGVVAGALTMSAPIAALHLASPVAMGFGDVKLSIVLGAAIGTVDWRLALVALCAAGLLGATYGAATRRRTVPFGPFLVAGSLGALLAGGALLTTLVETGAPS
jgi:leader peptidase (prepilin peptidase)/N-methyltransferase